MAAHQQNVYFPAPSYAYQPATAVTFASSPSAAHLGDQQWKHYTSTISPQHVTRFSLLGSAFILIGLLSIGLEVGLLINGFFEFGVGFYNGGFLFLLGILTLVLGRQQVFALTTLFVLIFFQFIASIGYFIFYFVISFILRSSWLRCSSSTYYDYNCSIGTIETIIIVNLIHVFITFCLLIFTLVTISHARRPTGAVMMTPQVIYNNQITAVPVSFENPCNSTINSSSTA